MSAPAVGETGPRFPADRGGVAILGCGTIAQSAHLPAYEQYGVGVAGVWSRSPGTTRTVRERFPFVGRVYDTADDLLADPAVRFVDIATGPEGRLEWIAAAIAAGKHVLAQKPLTLSGDDLRALPGLLAAADAAGVRVAVNHNGRWAPPWRAATLLLRAGAVGDLVGVTHLHDKPLPPLAGTPFDDVPHMLLTDYLLHWVDITRTWLRDGGAGEVVSVQAVDSRVPGQPADALNPWSATLSLAAQSGASAVVRIAGNAVSAEPGCPFWVHGTTGTLRGSVLLDSDRLEHDDGSSRRPIPLQGAWFVDGFAAAMGELMCAVAEGRQPENSAADASRSVALVLAARESAERGGVPVAPSYPLVAP
ncbi:Gfo/Idh/MocA family protein [Nocardioides sp. zg-1228]|uniref:Gfo/Idh/MocA family protein n=1 Tax=Nocardioides sp. zg-1228 TaxID=2763008 RepID=UPI00164248D8|nr:Gfo/Idh/MocA family oxidoreductase [Nocardioides sp. zg-1228]MBC2932954.1 Gfo/Idh/MocA family oxidoreductase [Nocardioides sp. zg-1228]QSF56845.1 Gfo/Idh/MocA family oxidoreductase [Nocardioides sp. zg-1228]